jgi:hypothetical protein
MFTDSHEEPRELSPVPLDPSNSSDHIQSPGSGTQNAAVLAQGQPHLELEADQPVHTEPTQENVLTLGSQLYEGNKVQEWAEEVNERSNQSTWSASKEPLADVQPNGTISSGSHAELPRPVISEADRDESSHTSAPEVALVYGASEDYSKTVATPERLEDEDRSYKQPPLSTITEHLLHLATTKIWADWVVMVNATGLQPLATYAHSLVLVRSTRLQSLMQHERAKSFGSNVINLYPPREILPQALEAALRFLYSDNVVAEDYPFPKDATSDSQQARKSSFNYILSYWMAGIELSIPPVAARAEHLLESFLGWDVAELILKEAEQLILSTSQRAGECGSEPDYAAVAIKLRQIVLRFLSTHINTQSFKIDPASPINAGRSRFTLLEEARLRPNPALASMVFGSMPSSADLSPSSPQSEMIPMVSSPEDQAASNIILNLDFGDLEYFCEHLRQTKGVDAGRLVDSVVDEREHRRIKVISNSAIPNKQRIANSALWDIAGYREYVQDGYLRRERVGFLLPTKTK